MHNFLILKLNLKSKLKYHIVFHWLVSIGSHSNFLCLCSVLVGVDDRQWGDDTAAPSLSHWTVVVLPRAGQTRLDPTRRPDTTFPSTEHGRTVQDWTVQLCTHLRPHYHCQASQSHSAYHKTFHHNLVPEYSYQNIYISQKVVPRHRGRGDAPVARS